MFVASEREETVLCSLLAKERTMTEKRGHRRKGKDGYELRSDAIKGFDDRRKQKVRFEQ
jgi:hypothetical protein